MFYTFSQNNSDSKFIVNEYLTEFVIIEAEDASMANDKAETLGIYFDGVCKDIDCECCGDRWNMVADFQGTETPMIFGRSFADWQGYRNAMYCIIYYADGSIVRVKK